MSVAEFFIKDPLEMTDKDIDEIIAYYRSIRNNFNEPQKQKLTVADEAAKLDLGDLKI